MDLKGAKKVVFEVAKLPQEQTVKLPQEQTVKYEAEKRVNFRNETRNSQKRAERIGDACCEGTNGCFLPIQNDFSLLTPTNKDFTSNRYYQDDPGASPARRQSVRRFRFVVCSLGLVAVAMSLMSRMLFNLALVEMTKKDPIDVGESVPLQTASYGNTELITDLNELATFETGAATIITEEPSQLRFDWDVQQQNLLLSAFYYGYAPTMMFGGRLAERYGSKWPLIVCVFGSASVNLLTPTFASISLNMLIGSRVVLGVFQGGLIPAIYELFNRWLTSTEASIFVPLVKVSFAAGTLFGNMVPGIMALLKFDWPIWFYLGGSACVIWSIIWCLLATSLPQTNSLVRPNELHRIMRKKPPIEMTISTIDMQFKGESKETKTNDAAKSADNSGIPWKLILTNPSVLALTLVKFTYNIGMDFLFLELAIYLGKVHNAQTETISAIASVNCLMQMVLITFVGWLTKTLVQRKALGLSRTKWRKVFQSISNFGMAAVYFMLPIVGTSLEPVAILVLLIFVAWMFGAGGESMVPYDLSSRYPATIMGLAHSVSIMSGIVIPSVSSFVLGNDDTDPERWNILFNLTGCALTIGGLVFVFVLKAKPFLPGEKELKSST